MEEEEASPTDRFGHVFGLKPTAEWTDPSSRHGNIFLAL
jgi:hypothetical protein